MLLACSPQSLAFSVGILDVPQMKGPFSFRGTLCTVHNAASRGFLAMPVPSR